MAKYRNTPPLGRPCRWATDTDRRFISPEVFFFDSEIEARVYHINHPHTRLFSLQGSEWRIVEDGQ